MSYNVKISAAVIAYAAEHRRNGRDWHSIAEAVKIRFPESNSPTFQSICNRVLLVHPDLRVYGRKGKDSARALTEIRHDGCLKISRDAAVCIIERYGTGETVTLDLSKIPEEDKLKALAIGMWYRYNNTGGLFDQVLITEESWKKP